MRLEPDAGSFIECYKSWHTDVASLITSDKTGATFGVYGRWGSGKSSACAAIRKALVAEATKQERFIGIVEINLMDVSSNQIRAKIDSDVLDMVGTRRGPKLSLETSKGIGKFLSGMVGFGSALMLSKHTAPELAVEGSALVSDNLSSLIEKLLEPFTSKKSGADEIIDGDQMVMIFDDLDRCYPDKAIEFLSKVGDYFHQLNPKLRFNLIIACDPEVLARHASHVFGISFTEGLESISKYVHVPLQIPISKVSSHYETMKKYIVEKCDDKPMQDLMLNTVGKVVGVMPMREILSAIPQTVLWSRLFCKHGRYLEDCIDLCLFWSIVSINLPSVLRNVIKSKNASNFVSSLFRCVDPVNHDGRQLVRESFGENAVNLIALRPDLMELRRLLVRDPTSSLELIVISAIGSYASTDISRALG